MKKRVLKIAGLALVAITGVAIVESSCNKPETVVSPPVPGNEFLTTVAFRCINTAAPFDTTTAIWRNLNPAGTQAPDTSEAILNFRKNSTYTCWVYIFDESQTTKFGTTNLGAELQPNFNINNLPSTTVNVTTEIRQRQNYHLVCFTPTGGVATTISVVRTDYDTNTPALQVGLDDNVTTINASTGRMEMALHHQPNVKNGSCSPGSDDFDIFYGVTIN